MDITVFKQKHIKTALKYYQNYLEGLNMYDYTKHLKNEYYEETKFMMSEEFDYINQLELLIKDEKMKILNFDIRFLDSDNPNDFDQETLKKMVFHMDVDKYSNPTFEGYHPKHLKVYYNYKKQHEQK